MIEVRVAIYARASTIDAAASIQDQFLVCRAEASRSGSIVVQSYADTNVSGRRNAPEVNRMVDDAADHRFKAIICLSLDRLSRRKETIDELTAKLNALGIEVIECRSDSADFTNTYVRELLRSALSADMKAKARRRAASKARGSNPEIGRMS